MQFFAKFIGFRGHNLICTFLNPIAVPYYGNASITLNKLDFVIPGSFFLIEVSYERAENELSRDVIFLVKIPIPSAK